MKDYGYHLKCGIYCYLCGPGDLSDAADSVAEDTEVTETKKKGKMNRKIGGEVVTVDDTTLGSCTYVIVMAYPQCRDTCQDLVTLGESGEPGLLCPLPAEGDVILSADMGTVVTDTVTVERKGLSNFNMYTCSPEESPDSTKPTWNTEASKTDTLGDEMFWTCNLNDGDTVALTATVENPLA